MHTEEKNSPSAELLSLLTKKKQRLQRKEVLCPQKSKFQNFYAIQRGALKTYQVEADGKEMIRGFYFAGEVFGYEAIYCGHHRFAAVALTETLVCEIPYDKFLELLHASPALQKKTLFLISQQLNLGSCLASTTAERRIATFLIELATRLPSINKRLEFILPLTRQDIGNYLRLTAETVSRIFSRFQQMKIIRINHKKINFLKLEKLKQIAEGI